MSSAGSKSIKKQRYFAKLSDLVTSHNQILVVEADNVGSRQMAEIRFALRGCATLLMGKNTMIRTALRPHIETNPKLEALLPLIKENVGMVFCKDPVADVKKVILEHRVPAPAKQGAVAPISVAIPPGPTGMDPGQTSFFQALSIATKIVKGQIEIQNEVQVIREGDRVTASQAVLLQKLNIKPFSYGLKPTTVYDDGVTYPATVLDIDLETLKEKVAIAGRVLAALSLGAGVPTQISVPHSIIRAFQQVCAVGLHASVMFPQLEALKEALERGPVASAIVAKVETAPAKEEAPAEEEEAEEEEDMGFGLFD